MGGCQANVCPWGSVDGLCFIDILLFVIFLPMISKMVCKYLKYLILKVNGRDTYCNDFFMFMGKSGYGDGQP